MGVRAAAFPGDPRLLGIVNTPGRPPSSLSTHSQARKGLRRLCLGAGPRAPLFLGLKHHPHRNSHVQATSFPSFCILASLSAMS